MSRAKKPHSGRQYLSFATGTISRSCAEAKPSWPLKRLRKWKLTDQLVPCWKKQSFLDGTGFFYIDGSLILILFLPQLFLFLRQGFGFQTRLQKLPFQIFSVCNTNRILVQYCINYFTRVSSSKRYRLPPTMGIKDHAKIDFKASCDQIRG